MNLHSVSSILFIRVIDNHSGTSMAFVNRDFKKSLQIALSSPSSFCR